MKRSSRSVSKLLAASAVSLVMIGALPSAAQNAQEIIEMQVMMTAPLMRAADCGLIAQWEERAFNLLLTDDEVLHELSEVERMILNARMAVAIAWTPCNSPELKALADFRGFLGGYLILLPQHLELFRSLAAMESPPQVFVDRTTGVDLSLAVSVIDFWLGAWDQDALLLGTEDYRFGIAQRFPSFVNDGAWVQGNETYRAIADRLAQEIAAAANGAESIYVSQSQATTLIFNAVLIAALWVADGCPYRIKEDYDFFGEASPDYERLEQCAQND